MATSQPVSTPAFEINTNPYKAKRSWPPDFTKLSDKHQFRLERKYKRRSKLKWARPRFMAATRIFQWGAGLSVLVYGVLFMDWGKGNEEAFTSIRQWYRRTTSSFWSQPRQPRFQETSKDPK